MRIWPHGRTAASGTSCIRGSTTRTAANSHEGPILQKGVTPVRAFVSAPMHYGRMFLAGDAAHIVPPTGAKGLNLAVADVRVLSRALIEFFRTGATERLDRYSDTCLKRVWKVVRYSNYMTSLLHRFETHSTFERRVQLAELEYVAGSLAARTTIARKLRRPAVRGGLTPPLALRILPTALPAGSSRCCVALEFSPPLSVVLSLGPIATQAQAQDYPSRPIRLLIHTPPGSLVDVLGRLVGQELEPAPRPEHRRRQPHRRRHHDRGRATHSFAGGRLHADDQHVRSDDAAVPEEELSLSIRSRTSRRSRCW